MNLTSKIKNQILDLPQGTKINASDFYIKHFNDFNEASYFKVLERLTESGLLAKAGKGLYFVPTYSKYGPLAPSEDDIIRAFIPSDESGCEIGYGLYNRLRLTTQVPNKRFFLSSTIDKRQRKVGNVMFYKAGIEFTEQNVKMIEMLDVLQHYEEIQDLDTASFWRYAETISKIYRDDVFSDVSEKVNYKKSTMAFLKEILDHFKVKNDVCKKLSSLSEYHIPDWQEKKQ